jgi:Tfp pilus assembly protein PilN
LPDGNRQRAEELLTKLLSALSTDGDLSRLLQEIDDLKDGTDDPLELLERCVLLFA